MVVRRSVIFNLLFILYLVFIHHWIYLLAELLVHLDVERIFYGINDGYKRMLKMTMNKISNPESIRDEPNFYKFMQVH